MNSISKLTKWFLSETHARLDISFACVVIFVLRSACGKIKHLSLTFLLLLLFTNGSKKLFTSTNAPLHLKFMDRRDTNMSSE